MDTVSSYLPHLSICRGRLTCIQTYTHSANEVAVGLDLSYATGGIFKLQLTFSKETGQDIYIHTTIWPSGYPKNLP